MAASAVFLTQPAHDPQPGSGNGFLIEPGTSWYAISAIEGSCELICREAEDRELGREVDSDVVGWLPSVAFFAAVCLVVLNGRSEGMVESLADF